MSKLLKLALVQNKKNGQLNTSFQKRKLPKELLKEIERQPGAVKKLILEYKGWE